MLIRTPSKDLIHSLTARQERQAQPGGGVAVLAALAQDGHSLSLSPFALFSFLGVCRCLLVVCAVLCWLCFFVRCRPPTRQFAVSSAGFAKAKSSFASSHFLGFFCSAACCSPGCKLRIGPHLLCRQLGQDGQQFSQTCKQCSVALCTGPKQNTSVLF